MYEAAGALYWFAAVPPSALDLRDQAASVCTGICQAGVSESTPQLTMILYLQPTMVTYGQTLPGMECPSYC